MKKNKIFIILAVVVITAVIVYFLKSKKQTEILSSDGNEKTIPAGNPTKPPVAPSVSDGWVLNYYPLKKGMQGELVSSLQAGLNLNYYQNIAVDGKFGEETYRAVINSGFRYPVSYLTHQEIILTKRK